MQQAPLSDRRRLALSPSIVMTNDGDGLLVTDGSTGDEYAASPLLARLLGAFAAGASIREALAPYRDEVHRELRSALRQLIAAKLVVPAGRVRSVSPWSPIDRVFHQQLDRADAGHVRSAHEPRPRRPLRRTTSAAPVPLSRTDDSPARTLREVLSARRSVRAFARAPLPLAKLAAFLGASAATRHGRRVTPSASRHGIDCYVACYRVSGLPPGLYAYDRDAHALSLVRDLGAEGARLARRTAHGLSGRPHSPRPSVIIVSTAHFAAELSAFRRIGYHVVLREAGAQLQTFYLVATDLGLAPCVLGAWESRRLERWLALDGVAEAVVGVFALGLPRARQ